MPKDNQKKGGNPAPPPVEEPKDKAPETNDASQQPPVESSNPPADESTKDVTVTVEPPTDDAIKSLDYTSAPPPVDQPKEDKPLDMSKPYKTDQGQFGEHGMIKYYIKDKKRKQIEKDNKLVFEDDGTECQYFPNLLPDEAAKRRKSGEIF